MTLLKLCSPALIYLVFSIVQIILDTLKGYYNTAFMKSWVAIVFTILLNYLCSKGLDIISWIIVFIPFIMMTVVISVLLLVFGLNPTTGKTFVTPTNQPQRLYVDARAESAKQNNNVSKSSQQPIATTSASYNSTTQTPYIVQVKKDEKVVIKED